MRGITFKHKQYKNLEFIITSYDFLVLINNEPLISFLDLQSDIRKTLLKIQFSATFDEIIEIAKNNLTNYVEPKKLGKNDLNI